MACEYAAGAANPRWLEAETVLLTFQFGLRASSSIAVGGSSAF